MEVDIRLEWTPNPSTLKYVVNRALLPRGAMSFVDKATARAQSPLAGKLFDITGVTAVMLAPSFVTVTKGESGEWDELNDAVMATLETHLTGDEPVVVPELLERRDTGALGEVEQRIRDLLDEKVRPQVAMDGGDIVLDRFEDGVAYVQLQGSCSGCPSSTLTMRGYVESLIKDSVPEVREVIAL